MRVDNLRNIAIIAHVDHGKTTMVDKLLRATDAFRANQQVEDRVLDSNDQERERGITIKSNAVRVSYDADDGETYQFNLIDTPGHVDFTYEVSRSLAACEGAVLVVDATQGVEAQTVSNATLAMNANLDIVPAINKIDLPSAHPDESRPRSRMTWRSLPMMRVCLGQDRRGHPRSAGVHCLFDLSAQGRCERAAQGTHPGFVLRRVSWCRRHGAHL